MSRPTYQFGGAHESYIVRVGVPRRRKQARDPSSALE
jgi:hypothetical protein